MNSRDVRQSTNHSSTDFGELTELNRLSRREFPPEKRRVAANVLSSHRSTLLRSNTPAADRVYFVG